DVFASIAFYMEDHGWTADEPWGREVVLSREAAHHVAAEVARREGSCQATRDMTVPLTHAEWNALGVRLPGARKLPTPGGAGPSASLVSGTTRDFLVYGNYDVLLTYNCGHSYALTVGLLADSLLNSQVSRRKAQDN